MRRAGREKQEQREYYARWVHQIKTPIAAMQLLLQTQREESPERYKEQEEIGGAAFQDRAVCQYGTAVPEEGQP